MNQFQAMRVFTRVVDPSSFSLAGKQLGMSAAAVTRSVGMLEAHLNMRLLSRSTRTERAGRDARTSGSTNQQMSGMRFACRLLFTLANTCALARIGNRFPQTVTSG